MKTYLVGGAVRDEILGLPVRERDYVVVGATEEEMKASGFRQVGRDFPVFLDPRTSEEHALARTEKKVGPGHQGFVCHATPDVTLEEDLQRRDLTINAMAKEDDGSVIDPWGGLQDIESRRLRHVSRAFVEDPLRVLRVARFLAYLHHLGFHVAEDTTELLEQMTADGLLEELAPERVLAEVDKALGTRSPAVFFSYLDDIGAGARLWPEIDREAVNRLAGLAADDTESRFTSLFVGCDETTIRGFCSRYRCSNARLDNTRLVVAHSGEWASLHERSAEEIVELLVRFDAFRKRSRFNRINLTCRDIEGVDLTADWAGMLDTALAVNARKVQQDNPDASGPDLGQRILEARVQAIRDARERNG